VQDRQKGNRQPEGSPPRPTIENGHSNGAAKQKNRVMAALLFAFLFRACTPVCAIEHNACIVRCAPVRVNALAKGMAA